MEEEKHKQTKYLPLKEEQFKDAQTAIEGGIVSGDLENPELVRTLVEDFRGKTEAAPIEVISICTWFLSLERLYDVIQSIKGLMRLRAIGEPKAKVKEGGISDEDIARCLAICDVCKD